MENRFSRIVDALPGMVWTAHADGRIDFVNRGWSEYTGISADDRIGDALQVCVHSDDRAQLLERWHSMLASGQPGDIEARLRRHDGAYRWFLLRVRPLADEAGRIDAWCGMATDIEEVRQSQETLYARWWLWAAGREQHFRAISDGIPALISLLTPAGDVEIVNRHALEYYGATLDELKACTTNDTLHPDDRARVIDAWTSAIENGTAYNVHGRRRREDGAWRWFNMHGFPLRDAQENIAHWFVLERDTDDRRRAENLIAGEKRLLEMVANGRPMPAILESLCELVESTAGDCRCSVVLVDASGTHLGSGVGPSMPAGFIESIVGRPLSPDAGPCAMASHLKEQVIASDIVADERWQSVPWLEYGIQACWSTPLVSTSGNVLGAFAIYYDEPRTPTAADQSLIEQFTHIASIAIERAQANTALKQSEALLAEAQTLSLTGSFGWLVSIDRHFWSAETFRIFEYDPSTHVSIQLVLNRAIPEDVGLVHQAIERAEQGRDLDYECRFQMPSGALKHLHIVAHAALDSEGRLEYIGAVQDVTQHRRAEEALGRMRAELAHVARVTSLGALTASIAHEVNQPLSGIITNASTCLRMLAGDPPNIDGARETARRTIRDGNRASDVITRLRALFAKKTVTTESVDLSEVAREVLALSRSELQRARAIVRAEFAEHLPIVRGDRVQLQQVILNLLLNAADAMRTIEGRPRDLLIRTERDGDDRVRLTVRDSGIGFEAHDAERLFEAFYTTKSGGMGIGLSVSRTIIQSHNGRLWAARNEGPGAMFAFSLPSECASPAHAVPSDDGSAMSADAQPFMENL